MLLKKAGPYKLKEKIKLTLLTLISFHLKKNKSTAEVKSKGFVKEN